MIESIKSSPVLNYMIEDVKKLNQNKDKLLPPQLP